MARDLKLGERVLVSAAGWNESNAGESGEIIKAPWYSHIDEVEWCRVRLDSGREIQSETFALTRVPKCGTCGLAAPDGTCPDCAPTDADVERAMGAADRVVEIAAQSNGFAVAQAIGATLPPASERCESCDGWGRFGDDIPCPRCDGTGDRVAAAFPVDEPFRRVPPLQPKGPMFPVQQNPRVRDLLAAMGPAPVNPDASRTIAPISQHQAAIETDNYLKTKWIGEFLIHLGVSGVHLAEYAGGGIEPRVSSELSRERLAEVIAEFVSRS